MSGNGIIYKAVNKLNGRIYIGLTTRSLDVRIAEHLRDPRSCIFGNALRKYGVLSFEFSVVDTGESREILAEKEMYWIRQYDCVKPNGYNLTEGGEGTLNPSAETRAKMSLANIGNKRMLGKKHSDETKKKLSQYRTGIKLSEEHKAKIGKASLGRKLSDESKKKISIANKGKKKPWLAELNKKRAKHMVKP